MKFLVDRCAGQRLATWLLGEGHDVRTSWEREPDPGDAALLSRAAEEGRILITIDRDFGELVYLRRGPCGNHSITGCTRRRSN